ncbi:MAG: 1,4-dihydroxy-2-naphthoate polyprenyltransferase [Actinomycetes bacterium]
MEKQPSGLQLWILGARPQTLPAAFVPVFVAFGRALSQDVQTTKLWWCGLFALVVSVSLQVGVNYANDYSDGIKGTDAKRVGPLRLVGSGLVPAKRVKTAAFIAFGVAAVCGLLIALATTMLLIPVGVLCIAAGWLYTGGPKPYGYLGFGEVFVFVFFGLVATCGSVYSITQTIDYETVLASCIVGLLACALLVVNNLRDIPGDTTANKLTLAVRMGDAMTRRLYYAMFLYVALLILLLGVRDRSVLISLIGLVTAFPALKAVRTGARGRDLIPVLGSTGKAQLAIGLLLAVGLAL